VREISGWNGIECTTTGINIANLILEEGTESHPIWRWYIPKHILSIGATFMLTIDNTNGDRESKLRAIYYDTNDNKLITRTLTSGVPIGEKRRDTFSITDIYEDTYYIRLTSTGIGVILSQPTVQLHATLEAKPYESYRGQTHIIDWAEDIGTVYGGYVDLITGELV
jgi:hypothetical protein